MEEEVVAVEESHSCADGLEKTRGITEWTGASAAPVSLLLLPQRTPALVVPMETDFTGHQLTTVPKLA